VDLDIKSLNYICNLSISSVNVYFIQIFSHKTLSDIKNDNFLAPAYLMGKKSYEISLHYQKVLTTKTELKSDEIKFWSPSLWKPGNHIQNKEGHGKTIIIYLFLGSAI
jgi:hypothetical protein